MRKLAEEGYWMNHRPGGPGVAEEEGTAAPAHDLTKVYPHDVYTHPHYYGSGAGLHGGQKAFKETVNTLRRIRGNPEAPVTMYRSLPPEHADKGFRTGDWVSLHHSYAEGHGLHPDDPSKDWPVIKQTVPAKHLWNNGDSLDEFGYHGPATHGEISKQSTERVGNRRLDSSVTQTQRVAILLSGGDKQPGFQVYAHVSGNAVNILHCFAGETEYVTREGIKTLAETAGTVQTVLTQDPDTKQSYWVDAPIYNFGRQKLMRVNLQRNKITKSIYATAGHRWVVRRPNRLVTTENLVPGHRLAFNVQEGNDVQPSVEGIRTGIVFGDGYAHSNGRMAAITLWGEKDKQLLQYFPGIDLKSRITPNGIQGIYLGGAKNGLHADMKLLPSLEKSDEFLMGWLAGYFAADGTVSTSGQVILHSSKIEHLEFVRDVAIRLNISVFGIQSKERQGYGESKTILHQMQFVGSSVPESMLLIEEHRNRFAFRNHRYERLGWTVVSVEETDREEDVFCAVVPETETFTLVDNLLSANCPFCGSGAVIGRSDGTVECGYCTSVFTVQVQPAFNGFPQSVDGQEYPWPGAPNPEDTLAPTTPPGTNLAPGVAPPGGDPSMGGMPPQGPPDSSDPADGGSFGADDDDSEDDDDKPAFLKGKGDKKDDKKSDKKKGDNPFAKKKSYRTASGALLNEDDYLAHLALLTANDFGRAAQVVKSARMARGN